MSPRRSGLTLLLAAAAALLPACGSDGGQPGAAGAGAGAAAGAAGGSGAGGSAGSAAGGAGGVAGSSGGSSCDASSAAGLAVAELDLDAFPPYAIDGCRLLYIASASGDLLLRDLTTGSETTIAPAAQSPRRPVLSGTTLAWEGTDAGLSVVFVSSGGPPALVTGPFVRAGEPRAAADAVVFTAWLGADADGDTDVYLYDVAAGTSELVGGGAKQQRFADVSPTHLAYSDFSEDPSGYYAGDGVSLADIVLVERSSGKRTSLPEPGKQAFPMLGSSGVLGFLEWVTVHPVPKLQAYTLRSLPLSDPTATPATIAEVMSDKRVRPTAAGALFEWVVSWGGATTLHRALADGSAPPVSVPVSAAELFAPVANEKASVLAVRPTAGAPAELVAIPR
jgi:hypothetical protein